jgi:hypothetical protein
MRGGSGICRCGGQGRNLVGVVFEIHQKRTSRAKVKMGRRLKNEHSSFTGEEEKEESSKMDLRYLVWWGKSRRTWGPGSNISMYLQGSHTVWGTIIFRVGNIKKEPPAKR